MEIHVNTNITIERLPALIKPDITRVLLRPFSPASDERKSKIIARVMHLTEREVDAMLEGLNHDFSSRHFRFDELLLARYEEFKRFFLLDDEPSANRKRLIGSYFLCEYSLEAAAIFNPSMVLHPDQRKVPPGSARYIISLRSTGEGHISSISFRECTIDRKGSIQITPPAQHVECPEPISEQYYHKETFSMKLFELGLIDDFSTRVMNALGEEFTHKELDDTIDAEVLKRRGVDIDCAATAEGIRVLARSNFRVTFNPSLNLSEKVLFPRSPSQSRGIEDARFVRFVNEDGTIQYYATFTAYDGKITLPQMLETRDFQDFHMITLNGKAVQNKGMALFPRKIGNKYHMLSRQDNENIFLMSSDNLHFWHETVRIAQPSFPWQFVQLGNCGSPIETEAGWLVLSHGVGPMRKYCIGAFLLDLEDPSKIIGRLRTPLIRPLDDEREGYVPNVVYSCGAVIHNEFLIIPYAYSDFGSRFARVVLKDLLAMILQNQ